MTPYTTTIHLRPIKKKKERYDLEITFNDLSWPWITFKYNFEYVVVFLVLIKGIRDKYIQLD